MAGIGDLGDPATPLVTLDACNFIPTDFHPARGEKFWDILYVTRAVCFKRVSLFLNSIKQIYSTGRRPRVLLLCCIPPEDVTPADVVSDYLTIFTREERNYFTLLPLKHDYPFCLDSATVGFRCRVVANAAATEMPIVCMKDPASIIPSNLRKEPYLYLVNSDDEFPSKMLEALDQYDSKRNMSEISKHFSVKHTSQEIKRQLAPFLRVNIDEMSDASFNFNNLDIRLGRHHSISYGPNKVDMTILDFVRTALDKNSLRSVWNSEIVDFERSLICL
jgi:hypothetical protein